MADLIGIQIKDLSTAGAINSTTELPVQRTGVNKAEKINLTNLTNYVVSSSEFTTSLNTNVNSKISTHINASDPHGDRGYAASIVATHSGATDPHGDRAYAVNVVTTSVSAHINSTDPHGDRAFATAQITSHSSASDPHGDRAFATNASNTAVTTANTYTDNKINTEFTSRVGTSVAPLVGGKVPNSYINAVVTYNPYSSFPSTGSGTMLYIDTTGNDIYRWNGSSYINMTPSIDIGALNLTTNDIPAGTNTDRQYLTSAKDTAFTNKVSDVLSETTSNTKSIFSRKTSNVAYIKNINTSGGINITDNSTTISIYDNNYKYKAEGTGNVELNLNTVITPDLLNVYEDTNIFRIKGDIFVYSTTLSSGSTIVSESNVFNLDTRTALLGVTQAVPPVTSASIDNTGVNLTGSGLANSTLEIYDKTYTLITTKPINALGNFSHTFSPARVNGDPIYLYVKTPNNERSNEYTLYTPNTTDLLDITGVSILFNGLVVKGIAERTSTVELFNSANTSLGTATTDSNGFFEITLSTALVNSNTFTIESHNSLGATSDTFNGTVDLKATIAAYEIKINNSRTTVSGKSEPDSSINIYNSVNNALLTTLTSNSSGIFSGTLPNSASTLNSFNFIVERNTNLSQTVLVNLPPKITMQTPPTVIPILIDSVYDFIYKDITKKFNTNDFNFDIEIDEVGNSMLLKGTNNLNKNAKWDANLEITVEAI